MAVLVAAVMVTTAAPAGAAAGGSSSDASGFPGDPASLVNPYVGTENEGFDFPAAGAPFGMVQEVPLTVRDDGSTGCDSPKATKITGFAQVGVNACRLQYAPSMATTGPVTSTNPQHYGSTFTHDSVTATPSLYKVKLASYGIDASLTATTRSGWQRFTFPRTHQANVLFNTGNGVTESQIHVVGDRAVEGWVRDSRTTYFRAEFNRPFTSHGTWHGDTILKGSSTSQQAGANGGWVSFDTTKDDSPVVVKRAISYTDPRGARTNLNADTAKLGFNFDAVQARLHNVWNNELHKIDVSGVSHQQQTVFYTALYHSLLDPNIIGDADGRYLGFDGKKHRAGGFTPYSNFSLWDTFRTQNMLIELLEPKVARDIDLSILAIHDQQGWLPRWFLGHGEGNIMTGDPVTPFLVEGWSKGLFTPSEAQRVYQAVRANATSLPPSTVNYNGRAGVQQYQAEGYIPYGLHVSEDAARGDLNSCPTHGNDNDCYYPVSATMEYASADASLALMARGLGHGRDVLAFTERARSYRNLLNPATGMFQPRTTQGTWLTPYNKVTGNYAFHEDSAPQYRWSVPQDPAGLVSSLGGASAATEALDQFFDYDALTRDPTGVARSSWVSQPYDYYGSSRYNPYNEPDLIAPYTYLSTGRPGRASTVVRAQQSLFTNTSGGVPGNDDMGELSAWYVMTSLGLYPTMSGANYYAVTSPQFPHARVSVGHFGTQQGGTLQISAPGTSIRNRYIAAARINGRPSDQSFVRQSDIAHGGNLDYRLSSSPTRWATGPNAAPPSVAEGPSKTRGLAASVTPAGAFLPAGTAGAKQQVLLNVNTTSPGAASVRIDAEAPTGWSVTTPTTVTIPSDGLPTQRQLPVTIASPPGTRPGQYTVTLSIRMRGAQQVRRTVTVTVGAQGRCAFRSGASCPVDLSQAYTMDGTATTKATRSGDFDGNGDSFDAATLPGPGRATLDGVTVQAPPADGTAKNFVAATGRPIALPAGSYDRADVVGAAAGGSTGSLGGTAVVSYTDGSISAVQIRLTNWLSSTHEFSNTTALKVSHTIAAGKGIDDNPASLFHNTVKLDPNKTVRAITLPNRAVSSWESPGLIGTAWDHDSSLNLYALTLDSVS